MFLRFVFLMGSVSGFGHLGEMGRFVFIVSNREEGGDVSIAEVGARG
jgi:hypothetical protein